MNALTRIRTAKRLPAAHFLARAVLLFILAWAIVLAAGNTQAADSGLPVSGILLAASDAHAAEAAGKDAKATGGKAAAAQEDHKAAKPAEKHYGPIGFVFNFLKEQPIVFLLLALAIGYPLGKVSVMGISLGPTAGTLLTGVAISLTAQVAFGITYAIPGILSSIFLLMFMYALGLKVGPQFFSGLKSGGLAFIVIGLTVWVLNWVICFVGVKLTGLAPGFAPGIISGSYTITAIIGVAQSAVSSGAYSPPSGITADQIGANIAAGYAISYLLSSVGIILLIRYLPAIFGHDPVADAKIAEKEMSGGATDPVPGAAGSLLVGFSHFDIRAYAVDHEEIVGKTVQQLFERYPRAPVLRIVRDGEVIESSDNPTIQKGDIIAVRADVHKLIEGGEKKIGHESDDELARDVPIEAADIRVGSHDVADRTLTELAKEIGFGLQLKAMFRLGEEQPILPDTKVHVGDVMRVIGPDFCVQQAAKALGGKPILDSAVTEVMYMALAMGIGYIVGSLSLKIAGIPFALGTSAGCLLAGILVSYWRSRNPEFGGPVSEGARSFLQDIGLNMFVAVLAANVGPKVLSSFQGFTVIWIAVIGTLGALVPPLVAFVIGLKLFKLNSVVAAGASTGARNSTPGLNAICAESKSAVAAVPYPLTYAITTVLALIGGYLAMILS
jgi:putative transport protein